ncbi:MAG: shikimate kinase [Thermaurantimonas sp.]|uniref:shikimate kinase n=1 Tax=Thermaurantimonas sp. TaxID=2681568 RepID=UPI00391C68A4
MQKKIVLLGYMGSGKTTIGRILANELRLPFWDLDEVIGQMFGMTVPYMIQKKGEIFFRECEQKALNVVLQNPSYILASGGGTPCYYDNIDVINAHSTSIYFQCSPTTLSQRLLPEKQNRPLIADIEDKFLPEYIAKHLFERTPFYEKAHITIDANREMNSIVSELLEKLSVYQ